VILAAAAAARAIGAGSDLWIDEVYSLVEHIRLPVSRILTEFPDDNEHVLYTLLAHAARFLFGESAAMVRLPALLFGLGSLWAVWRLGRLLAGPREALIAMSVLAFSYHHVWFSQNARGYTGLLLASVVATELMLRGLWRARPATWLAYAVVVALGMWVHLTMIFVAAAHLVVLLALLFRDRSIRQGSWYGLAALAFAGLLTFQLYALVVPQMAGYFLRSGAGAHDLGREVRTVAWLVGETMRGLSAGATLGGAGVLAGGGIFAAGLVSLWRRDRWSAILLLLPAAIGGVSMILLGRNLWPRFFFNSLGFAALLGVFGAMVIAEKLAHRLRIPPRAAAAVCAVALVAASAVSMIRVYRYPKQDFTGARDFVTRLARPGDRIVGLKHAGRAYRSYYAPNWKTAWNTDDLRASAGSGATYALYTFPRTLSASDPALRRVLQTDFELLRVFPGTLGDGAIYLLRRKSAPPVAESRIE